MARVRNLERQQQRRESLLSPHPPPLFAHSACTRIALVVCMHRCCCTCFIVPSLVRLPHSAPPSLGMHRVCLSESIVPLSSAFFSSGNRCLLEQFFLKQNWPTYSFRSTRVSWIFYIFRVNKDQNFFSIKRSCNHPTISLAPPSSSENNAPLVFDAGAICSK